MARVVEILPRERQGLAHFTAIFFTANLMTADDAKKLSMS